MDNIYRLGLCCVYMAIYTVAKDNLMYKDKDKQREANRLQMQRARAKGNTEQDNGKGNTGYPRVTDQEFTKLMAQAKPGHVRVSKPGDADYEPQCETTRAFVDNRAQE